MITLFTILLTIYFTLNVILIIINRLFGSMDFKNYLIIFFFGLIIAIIELID